MRFVSWNVNGLRACMNKGFMDTFRTLDADFFCLQETKLQEGQIQLELPGYHQYWCYAQKKGYSGTAVFTKYEPMTVSYGLGIEELDTEGRLITLEYPEFYLVTCYTPNAQRGLARIDHRLRWEEAFRSYLKELDRKKTVIVCGDLNVAHKEIDLKNPGSNRGNAGFSDEERSAFSALLDSGFTDTFRHLYPDKTGAYSWWSYMFNARQNNAGWRIDYFLVSDRMKDVIFDATIHPEVMGSDHCPVGLDLDTTCNGGIRIPTPDLPQIEEPKEANGDPPVGSVHMWRMIGVLAILTLILSIPAFLLLRDREGSADPPTTQPQVTAPHLQVEPLIHDIIDRTGTIEFAAHPTSSIPVSRSTKSPYHFISGSQDWPLYGSAIGLSSAQDANFHIQVVFDPDRTFTPGDMPSIIVTDMMQFAFSATTLSSISYCYYYEGDRIAGCFVYGPSLSPTFLTISASYQGRIETSEVINVQPTLNGPLIGDPIVLPADIRIEYGAPALSTSAYIPVYFVSQTQTWEIVLDNELPLYDQQDPNFFIQICFPESVTFTTRYRPSVSIQWGSGHPTPENEDLELYIQYYYNDDRQVAGAFVYGHTSTDMDLPICVSLDSISDRSVVHISPDLTPIG